MRRLASLALACRRPPFTPFADTTPLPVPPLPDFKWDKMQRRQTMREAFTKAILNDPRFDEAKPSGKGFVIGGAKPSKADRK
jgi:hypothetical protein